jgi:hypothetical protein
VSSAFPLEDPPLAADGLGQFEEWQDVREFWPVVMLPPTSETNSKLNACDCKSLNCLRRAALVRTMLELSS